MTRGRHSDEPDLEAASMLPFAMPPKDIVAEGINLYFQYCHKQPLWLFDPEDLLIPEKCRSEVVFGILSLALCYSKNPLLQGRTERMCRQYAEAARSYAMFRVAQGTVNLSTMQSLCLIALAEYIGESSYFIKNNTTLIFSKPTMFISPGCTLALQQTLLDVPAWILKETKAKSPLKWKSDEGFSGVSIT